MEKFLKTDVKDLCKSIKFVNIIIRISLKKQLKAILL